jgi:hypothetical protein
MGTKKQEYEKWIVEGFLKTVDERAIEIEMRDKPDVIVAVQEPDGVKRVGIEVRVYFNDETIGEGSVGQQLNRFWASVQEEIETLKTESGRCLRVHAYVGLKKDRLVQISLMSLVKKLAAEIFGFVVNESETARSSVIIVPDWEEREFSEFPGYRLMREYVHEVRVHKGFFAFWDANVNATHVGVSPKRLAEIIREKGSKARDYDTSEADELWLLIAAPHDTVFNAMHAFPEQAHLEDQDVLAACSATPFDRIFFWSSPPHEWAKQIWPKATQ